MKTLIVYANAQWWCWLSLTLSTYSEGNVLIAAVVFLNKEYWLHSGFAFALMFNCYLARSIALPIMCRWEISTCFLTTSSSEDDRIGRLRWKRYEVGASSLATKHSDLLQRFFQPRCWLCLVFNATQNCCTLITLARTYVPRIGRLCWGYRKTSMYAVKMTDDCFWTAAGSHASEPEPVRGRRTINKILFLSGRGKRGYSQQQRSFR